MPRFRLVPAPTADGRHIVLHAVPVDRWEPLRRLGRALQRAARRAA